MIVEMLYTSAPNTLDGPGYGVVAQSKDFPERLERFLRALNRYDFAPTVDNGGDGASPVVFSHTIFRDHQDVWHILSRVGCAGYDYTQRAVFLAHHVAVTPAELSNSSVATLIREPLMFATQWDGHVGLLPTRLLPTPFRPMSGASIWDALAGDRDWARVWVGRWSRHKGKPCFLILPAAADATALFEEALALLPPEDAEQVTFINHLGADRAGIQFDWIGLPAGSDLARSTQHRHPERTLNLSRPLGRVPQDEMPQQRVAAVASRSVESAPPRTPGPAGDPDFDTYWVDEVRAPSRPTRARPDAATVPAPPPPPPPRTLLSGNATPVWIAAAVALAMVVGGSILGVAKFRRVPLKGAGAEVAAATTPDSQKDNPAPTPRAAPPVVDGLPPRDEPEPRGPKQFPELPINPKVAAVPAPLAPRVIHLQRWLSAELPEGKKEDEILTLDVIPALPKLTLLSPQKLGLKFDRMKSDRADPGAFGIEVGLKEGGKGTIEILLRRGKDEKNATLAIRLPSESAEELLNRLQLSVLQIDSNLAELVNLQPVRVIFTPVLPALSFDNAWKTPSNLKDEEKASFQTDEKAFFQAIHKFQKEKALDAQVRIDRVTLFILPPGNDGWKLNNPVELGQEWQSPLDVAEWKTNVRVQMTPDMADASGSPSIVAKVDAPEAQAKLEAALKKQDAARPPAAPNSGTKAVAQPGNEALPEPRDNENLSPEQQQRVKEKNAKDKVAAQKQRVNEDRAQEQRAQKQREEVELLQNDPTLLLHKLFLRYGRIHGAIVIRVPNGDKDEAIDVLRFGDDPHPSDQTPPRGTRP